MKRYAAPWSGGLIVSSAAISALVGSSVAVLIFSGGPYTWAWLLPGGLWMHSLLFMVRGYTIRPGVVLVHRLLWATRLTMSGLESVRHDPEATKGSWRLFGNGGLFGATGWYYNRRLGRFRAFLTDRRRAVVLRYASRTVVLSPDDPTGFVTEMTQSQPSGVQPSGA